MIGGIVTGGLAGGSSGVSYVPTWGLTPGSVAPPPPEGPPRVILQASKQRGTVFLQPSKQRGSTFLQPGPKGR